MPSKIQRGRPYQQLVADAARAFDPGASVTEGEWVQGPDGRLDMDVAIRGHVDGSPHLAVIECKDFDAASTGRVGREFVDALDSKRLDLRADTAVICSNSGFTADALRKAARKGIGMISVLRQGDSRVRAEIHHEVMLRRIRFGPWRFTYHGHDDISGLGPCELHRMRFQGRSLDTWLQQRAALIAVANPSISHPLTASFTFTSPVTFHWGDQPVRLRGADVAFAYSTEWRRQTVRLDAVRGIYDYIRRRVRLQPGDNKYEQSGIDWEAAQPCDPPEASGLFPSGIRRHECDMRIVFCGGLDIQAAPESPKLEPYVEQSDLDLNLSAERAAP